MATGALHPCAQPGCPRLLTSAQGARCEEHKRAQQRAQDERRGSRHERGYTNRWARAARLFLAHHPLCVACECAGRITAATEVDHIRPHKGDPALFWDESNWQPLCKPCHSRKTMTEDGGPAGWQRGW